MTDFKHDGCDLTTMDTMDCTIGTIDFMTDAIVSVVQPMSIVVKKQSLNTMDTMDFTIGTMDFMTDTIVSVVQPIVSIVFKKWA